MYNELFVFVFKYEVLGGKCTCNKLKKQWEIYIIKYGSFTIIVSFAVYSFIFIFFSQSTVCDGFKTNLKDGAY